MTNKKHLVCTKPFKHMEIVEHGNYQMYQCCSGMLTTSTGYAYDKLMRVWNNDTAQSIRKSVIDGSFSYCKADRCFDLANKTNDVQYVDDDELEQLKTQIINDGPTFVNFAYDQSCNLKCPSCRTDIKMASKPQREYYESLAEKIVSSFDTIDTIHIAGAGDPFASRHFWEFLKGDVLLNHPKIKLYLMTNALLCDQYHWDKMSHIHDRIKTIHVSIDASTTETYHINRAPGRWDTLTRNMELIKQFKLIHGFELVTAFVIQQNNWREMDHFIQLSKDWGADGIQLAPIANWGTFNSEDYLGRAVHYSTHPEYNEFIQMAHKIKSLNDPVVNITGNVFTNMIPLLQV